MLPRVARWRARFGPEPTPQPATGARLRHLEARRKGRSSALTRRAKPGPATQPSLVFRRVLQPRVAVSDATVLPSLEATKALPVAKAAATRTRASRRSASVPISASESDPVVSASGDVTVTPLPPVFELVGAKPSRTRITLPPLPPILLEGDLPAPRSVSAPASVDAVSLAAPVDVMKPSSSPVRLDGPVTSGASSAVPMSVPPSPMDASSRSETGSFPNRNHGHNPKPFPAVARRPEGSVWLTPRDPRTFLACWTFPGSVLDSFRANAGSGSWSWRLRRLSWDGPVVASGPLPANEGYVFIEVALPGVRHVLELGLDHGGGGWTSLAFSSPENTPAIPSQAFRMPTPPGAFPAPTPAAFLPESTAVVPSGFEAPGERGSTVPVWSISEEVLEEVLHGLRAAAPAAGSSELGPDTLESTTRLRRCGASAGEAGPLQPGAPVPVGINAESSDAVPTPASPTPNGFWMRVNAEVVLHGSTEPDAQVSIAGRPVRLRPDGSFTFRFALPDGDFTLPVVAVSGTGTDARAAEVRFVRQTRLSGAVGVHPIDPALRPPRVESLP
jgi:hypothetical protein